MIVRFIFVFSIEIRVQLMTHRKRIFAISGSTKSSSSNSSVLEFIAKEHANLFDVEIDIGLDKLPHFNPDLDNENVQEEVKVFRNSIEAADAVIICTPEYVFSLPGCLKNAIEWTVSTIVFSDKPVAIIVAAASGEKAFESLDLIMNTIEAKVTEGSKLLLQGVKGKIGKDGEITDQDIMKKIDLLVNSLYDSIEINQIDKD